MSGATTVHLAENDARGGVVMIGGGRPSALNLNDGTVEGCCGVPGSVCCYVGPDMDDWCSVGLPGSWCMDYQCHGDADDGEERVTRPLVRVGYNDIDILLAGFNQPYSGYPDGDGGDPDDLPDTWIAADFDHAEERVTRPLVRVGYNDIAILLYYFNDANGPPPADCQTANPAVP